MQEDNNLISAILSENMHRKDVDMLVDFLMHDSDSFGMVFQMIFETDKRKAWHAAWVIEKVCRKDSELISEEKNRILINFLLVNQHEGLQRICLTILTLLPVHFPVSVDFINKCFDQMLSPRRSISVQVLSMKMLCKICSIEKDFIPELKATLENTESSMYSPGYKAAKTHVLKSLEILSKKDGKCYYS